MKKMGIVMLAMLVASMFGCKSVDSERNPFDIMQEKANAITAAGGLAAVGTASSRNVSLALTKSKTRGRDELASIIEAKVNSLKKDFQEEIGEGKAAEFNSLFSNATWRQVGAFSLPPLLLGGLLFAGVLIRKVRRV